MATKTGEAIHTLNNLKNRTKLRFLFRVTYYLQTIWDKILGWNYSAAKAAVRIYEDEIQTRPGNAVRGRQPNGEYGDILNSLLLRENKLLIIATDAYDKQIAVATLPTQDEMREFATGMALIAVIIRLRCMMNRNAMGTSNCCICRLAIIPLYRNKLTYRLKKSSENALGSELEELCWLIGMLRIATRGIWHRNMSKRWVKRDGRQRPVRSSFRGNGRYRE